MVMGKISVKHYLNKKIKASEEPFFGDEPEYPVYYYITVNRKTIHKPSHIHVYLSDKLFETGVTPFGIGTNTNELMKTEARMITKACELFLEDHEAGRVEKRYRLLFRRGFAAKDEFINGLNSYIEFYTQSLYYLVSDYARKEIGEYFREKILSAFDVSMIESRKLYDNDSAAKMPDGLFGPLIGEEERNFYSKNLDADRLNLYYLEKYLHTCLASTNIKYGYDLPLVEWLYGDLKKTILDTLANKEKAGKLKQLYGDFGFNKKYFEQHFEPIINKVVTLDCQMGLYVPNWPDPIIVGTEKE